MTRVRKILVINPNSNPQVTHYLAEALQPLTFAGGPDVDSVAMPLRALVAADNSAAAFVIACYSDPGLQVCREATPRPVFGIAEAGVLSALARGDRFGVIAVAQRSIPRHLRYLRQLCLIDRFAGERPLNMTVAETASGDDTLARMIDVGRQLKDQDGANAIVMGCAGMSRHRAALEDALGIPVIDPTQAAVTMALGAVMFA
jgi:allantoin racemase